MKLTRHYSHGKLLISGEYAVLDGAWALGLPTRFGQSLSVRLRESKASRLFWESLDPNGAPWFQAEFDPKEFEPSEASDLGVAQRLKSVLHACRRLNPNFLNETGIETLVHTQLEFPSSWGLGSSSTLIYNIASWAGVDPYVLLGSTFGGSGYDIACAGSETPVLYRIVRGDSPKVRPVDFRPAFDRELLFVHLNRKQDSRDGINLYRKNGPKDPRLIDRISEIGLALCEASKPADFIELLREHEQLVSRLLGGYPPVGERLFSDYKGLVKSLGAWGGDFVLAVGEPLYSRDYFHSLGYETTVSYWDMVLSGAR